LSGREARLWRRTEGGGVLCLLCGRKCLLREGERGFCEARIHEGGGLKTLNYGAAEAVNLDPVEKKPLHHFLPGSLTFSVGAPGCTFDCLGCQNHSLSRPGNTYSGPLRETPPEALIRAARESGARSLSFTYSEPTAFFEYAEDAGRRGKEAGLPGIWVTNGFFSREALDRLDYVSAMNIDLKGFTEGFYREVTGGSLGRVRENIKEVKARGIWLEVTTLLIPTVNDNESDLKALAAFLAEVSPDIPWHVSRFIPLHRQSHLHQTPESSLERAREIGREAGLRHVYLGNVGGRGYSDTLCPGCGAPLIKRSGYSVSLNRLSGSGECPECGERIMGVW
jgi:pyruvate formate lyase activating enzyme